MPRVNHPLREAIESWCQKRLSVYKASSEQIRIDANSAEAVTKDHVNRWLFELIQNADDAGADAVKVSSRRRPTSPLN